MTPSTDENLLPDLQGVDTQAGMLVVGGRVVLYRKLLLKFRDSYHDFEQQFRAAQADEKEPMAAMRAAHSLKGAAGSVGALGVQQAASLLESGCEEHVTAIDELLSAVNAELQPVITGLDELDS